MSDATASLSRLPSRSALFALARDVIAVARERQVSVAAAGLAFHVVNTLVALSILLLVGVTVVDGLEYAFDALEAVAGYGVGSADAVDSSGAGQLRATAVALAIFGWSAVRLANAVNSTFTGVYGSRKRQSSVGLVLELGLIVVTVAVGVLLVGAVGVAAVAVGGIGWRIASPFLLAALLSVSLFPMYYVFPQADVSVREILPGAAFAALSWTVLALGFRVYVSSAESVDLFGAAGALALVLTWVYLGGLCLLLGAVLNAVLADRVEPEDGWIPLRDLWSGDP